MGNLLPGRAVVREDPYRKKPDTEPTNCNKIGDISRKPTPAAAEEEAMSYCKERPNQNCCTISGNEVTKWVLPSPSSPKNKVLLRAKPGGIFYYHVDLDVE